MDDRTAGTMPPSYGTGAFTGLFSKLFGTSNSTTLSGGNYGASKPSLNTEMYGPFLPTATTRPSDALAQGGDSGLSGLWNGVLGVFDKGLDYVGDKIEFDRYLKLKKVEAEADAIRRTEYTQTGTQMQPVLAGADPAMLLALGVFAFLMFKK